MRFWDTSALVPLVIEQPRSLAVNSLAQGDSAIATWWGSLVECHSAVARLRREAVLDRDREETAHAHFQTLARGWTEVEPSEQVRALATRLVTRHPLRAADALQLAAAQVWAELRPSGHPFVSLDNRLREAASREGFDVLP